jgi:hypothetical protein
MNQLSGRQACNDALALKERDPNARAISRQLGTSVCSVLGGRKPKL